MHFMQLKYVRSGRLGSSFVLLLLCDFRLCFYCLLLTLLDFFPHSSFCSFSFLLQQLGEEDKLRVDKIQATPVIQPLPDSVNSMWEKISQRAALNKESDITWDQIVESTSGTPPLSKDEFLSYTAGEPTLSSAGLIKLKEKQAVKTR